MGAVSKYIRIEAPARQVYDLWRDPSRFPDFMADVKQVGRAATAGTGRSTAPAECRSSGSRG